MPLRVSFDQDLYDSIEFVFLCFTNRCGSNFIAETLGSDGRLNVASEWWNGGEILRVCKDQNLGDFGQYLDHTARSNMRSGRLISKLAVDNLVLLYRSGFFESPHLRSRFVFVERSDKLSQAISLVLARETSVWAFNNIPKMPRADVVYDRSKIDACMNAINDQNARFRDFFRLNSIVPVSVAYEAFAANPGEQTNRIGRELGLADLQCMPSNIRMRKQADHTNDEWRRRYLFPAFQGSWKF